MYQDTLTGSVDRKKKKKKKTRHILIVIGKVHIKDEW